VRGIYDCGAGAPDVPEVPCWWRTCRIAGWMTTTTCRRTPADRWLGDDARPHPARFDRAFHGLEIMSGLYRSAVERRHLARPLSAGMDEIEARRRTVAEGTVLMRLAESAREYGG
jgi:hypothetical protein